MGSKNKQTMGSLFSVAIVENVKSIGLKTRLVFMFIIFPTIFFQFKFIISGEKEIAYVCTFICGYSCTLNAG